MIHLPKAGNPTVPVDVTLLDGNAPITGATPLLRIYCLETGTQVQFGDYTLGSGDSTLAMTALTTCDYSYAVGVNFGAVPRGTYQAIASVSVDDATWQFEECYSVGLYRNFRLGASAVYTPGTGVGLTLWLDEDGQMASDVTAITSVTIRNADGTSLAALGNATVTAGLGVIAGAVTMAENTRYLVTCTIAAPMASGSKSISCETGIVRP